jgi:hypothetical protein
MEKIFVEACVFVVATTASNFLWQAIGKQEWSVAMERSFFGGFSVFCFVFILYVKDRK